ncbi:MAG: four helix bundle protein [Rickettsiales bacterium]|jgi:four helix bundle protein|nr:four helix bundle protein [Rickettsiales bacterium]
MSKDSIALEKSKKFSVRIIRFSKYLGDKRREYVMSKQILRSGTGISANLSEAIYAVSRSDFLSKLYIALKECSETLHWLELLNESGYITDLQYTSMHSDCEEIRKMLSSATKTVREV